MTECIFNSTPIFIKNKLYLVILLGKNYNWLPPEYFCKIFMGVSPPCKGGVIALNGINGDILWTRWSNGNIFRLHCLFDIDGDQVNDCLAVGTDGTLMTINSKTGVPIWQLNTDETNLYIASFIADQNNDSMPDVLASLSSMSGKYVLIAFVHKIDLKSSSR